MLTTFDARQWSEPFSESNQQHAIQSLESGHLLHFPKLPFLLSPEEKRFLTPSVADPKSKNIGYHPETNKLWGVHQLTDEERLQLKRMMQRYAHHALSLIQNALPHYREHLIIGRTSYRPMEIVGRASSYRKDDKRLHVDAFPSSPNQGKRILRVFSNINPHGQARVWRVGEPFEDVAKRFLPTIKKPFPGYATLLNLLGITKTYRTHYDHYMLHLHDNMKADMHYQETAPQETLALAANTSWIVQTDHVSHAAMQGQYLLEQTFYLPVEAMQNQNLSPLRVIERLTGQTLA
ncbi:MAG TPA: Kdo hydroxylase family protein [Gammaproteobacteria bacterium]|jgi:hypothetical protein|nr:Kdo hydroxylase family protein [Gammaproteobacteria bacterium]